MLFPRSALFVAFLPILALTSCGKHEGARFHEAERNAPVTGDLAPLVGKFADAKPTSPCDRKFLPVMGEIAKAVDAHSESIDAYLKSLPPDPDSVRSKFGPIVVQDPIVPKQPQAGWYSESKGWESIRSFYERMKDSSRVEDWYALNRRVRGILTDDRYRILDSYVPYRRHEDGERLARIESALRSDPGQAPAALSRISEADRAWLRATPYFRERFASFEAGVAGAGVALLDDVNYEANEYRVTPQPGVDRNGTELALRLHSGPFAAVEKEFADFVESIWKGEGLHLKIEWIERTPGLYELLVGPDGARSRTSWSKHFVEYASDLRRKILAHEIGHVLGLGDHYYTRWDEANCGYVVEYREDDIMSDETFAGVLPEELRMLADVYPDGSTRRP